MVRIQKTSDYSLFRLYSRSNRDVSKESVNALVISIQQKNMLESHPILVDNQMHVIDGQHRLAAAKILNLPVYFLIDENVDEHDIPRCQIQKKWETADYLKYYKGLTKEGEPVGDSYKDYVFVDDIYENYGFSGHLPFVIESCVSKNAGNIFRKGKFKIVKDKSTLRSKFQFVKEIKEQIKKHKENIYISAAALRAFWKLVSYKNYDHQLMLHKIDRYIENVILSLNFKKRDMICDNLLERVYNFFSKKYEKLGDN